MDQEGKFDGILMTIIQQKGNINGFFDTMFGFLRRRTDFFANQKQAEQTIVGSCKNNFEKFNQENQEKAKIQEKRKQQAQKKKKQKEQQQAQDRKKKTEQKPEPNVPVKVQQTKQQVASTAKKSQTKQQDSQPAPKGNGGRTQKYIWTQTLQNLEMFIFLQADVTKKVTKVNFTIDKLQVVVKGQTLISGKWKNKINAQQTYWTIQDGELDNYKGKYLHINVEKWKNQTSWWSSTIEGDLQINTQKINPEPSKLSDLEGQTRSTVQKMMFDMKQKQQGLPTSDQLQKQNKMKEFMKAHPEMDFSQCKFG